MNRFRERYKLNYLACAWAKRLLEYIDKPDSDLLDATTLCAITGQRQLSGEQLKVNSKRSAVNFFSITDKRPATTQLCVTNCQFIERELALAKNAALLIEYVVVAHANPAFLQFSDLLVGQLHYAQVSTLLQDICKLTSDDYERTLKQLTRAGILRKPNLNVLLGDELPDYLLHSLLTQKVENKQQLIAPLLHKSQTAQFSLNAFPQVDGFRIRDYLKSAVKQELKGTNVLLYGESGTGKTELARTLAKELGHVLYEVRSTALTETKSTDDFETKYPDKERLRYLSMISNLLSSCSRSLLLVDECETIFEQACYQYSKEHLQRLIEDNDIPCIWITNHIDYLEPSFIRRFKLITEVPRPTPEDIAAICKPHFKGLSLSSDFKRTVTRVNNISPAIIANAAHVAKTLHTAYTEAENVIYETVEATLRAAGQWESKLQYQHALKFDFPLFNIKQSRSYLDDIQHALDNDSSIRVLLSGPPGTGKTAFVHHLAEQHHRELIHVKASDVLSKWVGCESEQNIAAIFEAAHTDEKMILLDEVDSLLTSRESLNAHHELQLVNELLTQIESCSQPLFAATNLESRLDHAVLRRFDFKLQCTYLTFAQVLQLYKQSLGIKTVKKAEQQALAELTQLTPGDFAILARRKHFRTKQNHRLSAITLLAEENQRKQTKPQMGFIRPN